MQYKCETCEKEFKTLWGLSSHSVQKYKTKPQDLYIKHELDGVTPTCKCGCGELPNFLGIRKGFRDYILGHAARVNNNWGHNEEALKKSHETQKKMYESGELVIWNKGLTIDDDRVKRGTEKMLQNTERGGKISKTLTGRKRPQEVLDKLNEGMVKYWSKSENKEKKSHERMLWMKENDFTVTSKLETVFSGLLESVGIMDYDTQYYVRDTKSYYDFKVGNTLIEVDGDFWHCNPNGKHPNPIYESQHKNLKKDKIKNEWCEQKGITLLRFWETDINERPEWIKGELLKYLIKS